MATAEKILEIARSQIGTKESPAKSDNVKYNTAYYKPHKTPTGTAPSRGIFLR